MRETYDRVQFSKGYFSHLLTTASWEIRDRELLDCYRELLLQYGQPVPSEISAVIRVDSSDVAASGANIFCSLLEGPEKRPLVLGNALKLEHSGAATIEAFAGNVAQIFARHRETVEGLGKLFRVSRNDIIRAGNELVLKDKILEADGTSVFLKMNREAEKTAAYHIVRLLKTQGTCLDIEKELEEAQAESGIILAQKQKDAARMVFQSPVSIITGGPGKGKTTVLKVILNIYERLRQQDSVLLCAPTGRARKNLSDSTGAPAMTIHKRQRFLPMKI